MNTGLELYKFAVCSNLRDSLTRFEALQIEKGTEVQQRRVLAEIVRLTMILDRIEEKEQAA